MEPRHVVLIANTGWNVVRFRAELIAGLLEAGWQVSTIAAFGDEDLDRLRGLGARPVRLAIDAAGRNPVRDLIYLGQLARCSAIWDRCRSRRCRTEFAGRWTCSGN